MQVKTTTIYLNDLMDKIDSCLANKTVSVVKQMKYDVDCGDCICSLYSLILMSDALSRWNQYGDGTPTDINCLTLDQKTAIVNFITKECKDDCNGTTASGGTILDNAQVLATDAGDYIITDTDIYILI